VYIYEYTRLYIYKDVHIFNYRDQLGNWGLWNFEGKGPGEGPPELVIGNVGAVMALPGINTYFYMCICVYISIYVYVYVYILRYRNMSCVYTNTL
jgi:hypothetical protein